MYCKTLSPPLKDILGDLSYIVQLAAVYIETSCLLITAIAANTIRFTRKSISFIVLFGVELVFTPTFGADDQGCPLYLVLGFTAEMTPR